VHGRFRWQQVQRRFGSWALAGPYPHTAVNEVPALVAVALDGLEEVHSARHHQQQHAVAPVRAADLHAADLHAVTWASAVPEVVGVHRQRSREQPVEALIALVVAVPFRHAIFFVPLAQIRAVGAVAPSVGALLAEPYKLPHCAMRVAAEVFVVAQQAKQRARRD